MGTRLVSAATLAFTLAASGCGFFVEPAPDIDNPKTASAPGFTMSYPGNWKTSTEAEKIEGFTVTTLTIESSGNALAMIQVYEPGIEMGAEEVFGLFMSGVQDASKEELGGMLNVNTGSSTAMTRTVIGEEWQGRKGQFTVTLLGEKVPSRIETLQHYAEERSVVVFLQAPSEDWAKAKPGFDQVMDTLAEQ